MVRYFEPLAAATAKAINCELHGRRKRIRSSLREARFPSGQRNMMDIVKAVKNVAQARGVCKLVGWTRQVLQVNCLDITGCRWPYRSLQVTYITRSIISIAASSTSKATLVPVSLLKPGTQYRCNELYIATNNYVIKGIENMEFPGPERMGWRLCIWGFALGFHNSLHVPLRFETVLALQVKA